MGRQYVWAVGPRRKLGSMLVVFSAIVVLIKRKQAEEYAACCLGLSVELSLLM